MSGASGTPSIVPGSKYKVERCIGFKADMETLPFRFYVITRTA
jgi:hypothetical protein